jgi:pimeloyl-ACP methyl ester carboxylesterase
MRHDTAMPPTLARHFVTVDGRFGWRQVHFRKAGSGPVVVLLHQSPQSSREMEGLMLDWGDEFTLLAPDSPGYGHSDPLLADGRPVRSATIDDFAAATLEFLDAVGVGRFGVYGFHTGASIGTGLARAAPARVAAVAANGLVALTDAELEPILEHYLPPFEPRWDGGHLAWLWGRMREQTIFFPWHDRRAAARMDFDVPPAARLHAGLQEYLAAAEHYHVAYRAAFTWHAERHLATLASPLLITAAARDPLSSHLARIGARAEGVRMQPATDAAQALELGRDFLRTHPGDAVVSLPTHALPSRYLGAPGRQVHVREGGAADAPVVVLLPPIGTDLTMHSTLCAELAASHRVLAIDLPGHGASDPPARGSASLLDAVVLQIADALAGLSGPYTVLGMETAAALALDLARTGGQRCALLDPACVPPADATDWQREGTPPLEPVWAGGHLLEAWHLARDTRLFHPWFRRTGAARRRGELALDDAELQRHARALLRASGTWQPLLAEAVAVPVARRCVKARPRPVVVARADNAWSGSWDGATRAELDPRPAPTTPAEWLERLTPS